MKSQAYRMALLYDFYGDVFDEFYNGDDDVKSVYEKIYKKE